MVTVVISKDPGVSVESSQHHQSGCTAGDKELEIVACIVPSAACIDMSTAFCASSCYAVFEVAWSMYVRPRVATTLNSIEPEGVWNDAIVNPLTYSETR